jgi:predicted glycogen debranching enzyme
MTSSGRTRSLRVSLVNPIKNMTRSPLAQPTGGNRTLIKFSRFWNADTGYCYNVLDSPDGNDPSLRPNQIFAVSLPGIGAKGYTPLLTPTQQRGVVDTCARSLLTSYGLRSLASSHPQYQGHYGGNQLQRDGAYHQGTT